MRAPLCYTLESGQRGPRTLPRDALVWRLGPSAMGPRTPGRPDRGRRRVYPAPQRRTREAARRRGSLASDGSGGATGEIWPGSVWTAPFSDVGSRRRKVVGLEATSSSGAEKTGAEDTPERELRSASVIRDRL